MITLILAGLITCLGIDDTAAIQASLDVDSLTTLEGSCVIKGQPGLRIPSDREIHAYDATLTQTPNIGGAGTAGRNRVAETIPGAARIKWLGGRFIGSRAYVGGLQWSIGFRIDSASDILLQDATFEDFYTDGVSIGGNPPGFSRVTIRNVRISNSKRNALSVTCGSDLRIESSTFETTNCTELGTLICSAVELNMPRCGIDFEPNGGDLISNVRVTDSLFRGNERCGIFLQSGLGAAGSHYTLLNNKFENNGTIGLIANQVDGVTVQYNTVAGGTIGYSFGAGLHHLTFLDNEVWGNSGNAINFAGVYDPIVARNKVNGRPVAFISIVSPVLMNGVAGDVTIKPFE